MSLPAPTQLLPDEYLTDGRSLFRVLAPLRWCDGHARAELEDCLTLTARSYSAAELWSMRLSVVERRTG